MCVYTDETLLPTLSPSCLTNYQTQHSSQNTGTTFKMAICTGDMSFPAICLNWLPADHFQDGSHHVQVSSRPGIAVPVAVLHTDVILWWPSPSWICGHSSDHCPRMRTTYRDRSFSVNGPVSWNSLLHNLPTYHTDFIRKYLQEKTKSTSDWHWHLTYLLPSRIWAL